MTIQPKRGRILLAAVLVLMTLCACSSTSSTGAKALEEGKFALAEEDFSAAENYFKLAMDEGVSDEAIAQTYGILNTFNQAQAAFDILDYETAQTLLDDLDPAYQDLPLANEADGLKAKTATILQAAGELERATQYINGSQYAEGQVVLDGIDQASLTESQQADWTRLNNTITTAKTKSEASAPTVVVIQPPAGYYQPERITQVVPVYSGDYLFPSDTQYLSNAYLDLCSKSEVKLLRNEIYARHGYVFKLDEYREYFGSKSWYTPNPNFDVSMLNAIERVNVDTIVKYEDSMGW